MNSGAQVRTDHLIRLLGIYYHLTYRVFVWFSLICSRGGGLDNGSKQWHLIPLLTRAGRRWEMVWQGPRRGFVAETGRFCCYGDALSTIFLLPCFCALLPTFRFSFIFSLFSYFFLHPGMFIFFVSLRLCSSRLLLSASTYFIVRVLSACCVICTLLHLGILLFFYSFSIFFRSSYFSGGVFFVVLSYAVR